MRITLKDAKDSRIPVVLGYCPDAPEFLSILNEAQQRLITRGKFWGFYQKIRSCVIDGCLTWPRQVANIEAIAVDSYPIPVRNQWYEFLAFGPGLMPKTLSGSSCAQDCGWSGFDLQNYDRGTAVAFQDIKGANKQLRFYPSVIKDAGKVILVQGYDANNIWIRTLAGGVYIDGFKVTLAVPKVDSPMVMSSFTGIQLPATMQGNLRLFYFDSADVTQPETQMADYEPDETRPVYRRSFLHSLCAAGCGCPTAGGTRHTITAMAKLEFIPARNNDDWLMVGSLPALKEMCQSVKWSEMDVAGANEKAAQYELRALRELNKELDHYQGKETAAIGLDVYGGAPLERQRIGSMV